MRTYLVALDHSARAPHVLATAVDLAASTGAKLVLFRAVGLPHDLPHDSYALSPDEVIDKLRERAQADLRAFAQTVPSAVPCTTRLEVGAAWQTIGSVARELGADLILIGSHGFSGVDRLLGTTASRVVNHADRSVLVVRQTSPAGAGSHP
jgi:nucleotide-binding universal stress UspA family protein